MPWLLSFEFSGWIFEPPDLGLSFFTSSLTSMVFSFASISRSFLVVSTGLASPKIEDFLGGSGWGWNMKFYIFILLCQYQLYCINRTVPFLGILCGKISTFLKVSVAFVYGWQINIEVNFMNIHQIRKSEIKTKVSNLSYTLLSSFYLMWYIYTF